jgi:hypothetical protein
MSDGVALVWAAVESLALFVSGGDNRFGSSQIYLWRPARFVHMQTW